MGAVCLWQAFEARQLQDAHTEFTIHPSLYGHDPNSYALAE